METQKAMAAKMWALGALSFWPIVGLILFVLALIVLPDDHPLTDSVSRGLFFSGIVARLVMSVIWTAHVIRSKQVRGLHMLGWILCFWVFVPSVFLPAYWYKFIYEPYKAERMRLAFAA